MGRLLTHGTGPGHDLPIPLFHAVAGAGYLIAHYVTVLIDETRRAVVLTFGGHLIVGAQPFAPELVAVAQVLAIVTGHVLGVIAAHDRAVRLFEPRTAISGQVPLMVLMVIVTITGLTLLAVG